MRLRLVVTLIVLLSSGFALNISGAETAAAGCRWTMTTRTVRKVVSTIRGVSAGTTRENRRVKICDKASANPEPSAGKSKAELFAEAQARYRKAQATIDAFRSKATHYETCLESNSVLVRVTCTLPTPPALADDIQFDLMEGVIPTTPAVQISPQTAAYMAVAELTLTAPTPGIGPSPDINRWKIAAVGYPMWLWAEGDLNPAPVTDSIARLTVALDARIDKIVFTMGDGNTVTCVGTGTRWTRAVRPGSESPTCGYRYQKPSLPRGKYTVTARTYWAVDWQVNGTTGTIPLVQQASTQLPVGELQVVIR